MQFIEVISQLEKAEAKPIPEDLFAKGSIETTIPDVDKSAEDWVEQASEKVHAVKGNTYVELDRGILTVDQINNLLKSMPMEITYVDNNNQFLYYNRVAEGDEMFANRYPGQPGNPIGLCHPEKAYKNVSWVISQLRSGAQDAVRVHVPTHGPEKFVVHNYQAMHDENGNYAGVHEYILDFKPIVDWYLAQTGQELVGGKPDAVAGASKKPAGGEQADAVASASKKPAATPAAPAPHPEKADAVASASVKEKPANIPGVPVTKIADAPKPAADSVSSASKK